MSPIIILHRAPFIRSTSLKTGKTPPNTPDRGKKAVRFADALGLEFEYVKLISQDELPTVPRSAYQDLQLKESISQNGGKSINVSSQTSVSINSHWDKNNNNDNNNNKNHINNNNNINSQSLIIKPKRKISPVWPSTYNPHLPNTLVPEFLQPIASANFCDRVRSQFVCLENCIVSSGAGNISVTCVIRVLNIAFEKSVTVRHTLTEWQTTSDSLASYLPNSCDGWSDKFSATFSVRSVSSGGALVPGQRILFAIRYTVNGDEYWDNNMGLNYSLIYQA
ncbi:glycogen-binding subunit 76A [Tetranychus urticae]|uniref:glycogen-binding subunit 76A n=1 Tax=Tetranychus urticae TaxID=32264 RepID=UPI00077B8756|nr:glycogen-binding subunit 76A [Tetranychus urticae]